MSIYYNKQTSGELWLRDLKNSVEPSYNVLSSIYFKYLSSSPKSIILPGKISPSSSPLIDNFLKISAKS